MNGEFSWTQQVSAALTGRSHVAYSAHLASHSLCGVHHSQRGYNQFWFYLQAKGKHGWSFIISKHSEGFGGISREGEPTREETMVFLLVWPCVLYFKLSLIAPNG